MAKRNRQGDEPTTDSLDSDGILGIPAGDRPDEIALGGEAAEMVDFMSNDDKSGGDKGNDDDAIENADADVESREQRTRDGYDDDHQERRRVARDDDDSEYSKKVQRRINREFALRQRAEKRADEERVARQELEQRLAKIERESAERQTEMGLKDIEAKMRDVMARLTAAKDSGDTAKEVELQAELGDLQGQKVRIQARMDMDKAERDRTQDDRRTEASPPPKDSGKTRGAEWVGQQSWWNLSRFRDARGDAIEHDKAILRDIERGELEFTPYSDEHLDELARRLKSDHPGLDVRTIDGKKFDLGVDDLDDDTPNDRRQSMRSQDNDRRGTERGQGSRSSQRAPVGGMGGRDGRRERSDVEMARQGKVRLDEKDYQEIRKFKLDPNDPTVKKYFARERARTILAANGGARR